MPVDRRGEWNQANRRRQTGWRAWERNGGRNNVTFAVSWMVILVLSALFFGSELALYETTRATLLERIRDAGDEASWREFYELYQPLLYRYARARRLNRDVSEEILQECMAVLARKMPQFEYAKERGGFKYWLRRLVNNKINDFFKKKKLPLAQSADFHRASLRDDSADELWEQQWRKRHLKYCLELIKGEVAPQTYQAFECHVLADWPVERVTETLGLSADQVYAAKSRITKRLREKMKELIGEDL